MKSWVLMIRLKGEKRPARVCSTIPEVNPTVFELSTDDEETCYHRIEAKLMAMIQAATQAISKKGKVLFHCEPIETPSMDPNVPLNQNKPLDYMLTPPINVQPLKLDPKQWSPKSNVLTSHPPLKPRIKVHYHSAMSSIN
jgi:hypothetical protein